MARSRTPTHRALCHPPDQREWFPYAYANWCKFGQTMSDEKVSAFIRDMRARGILSVAEPRASSPVAHIRHGGPFMCALAGDPG